MTFEKGAFSRQEVVALCESLSPVDAEIAKHLLSVPFSTLSYSHRHQEPAVSVPVGYWKHIRAQELICFALVKEEIPASFLQAIRSFNTVLRRRNYVLSGGFGFGRNKVYLEEVEFLFEHQNAPGCFLRILCTLADSPFSIAMPPILGDQEYFNKTLNIHENTFYYATSKNFAFGSHEVVFKNESFNFLMIIKPAPWASFEWVMELLTEWASTSHKMYD